MRFERDALAFFFEYRQQDRSKNYRLRYMDRKEVVERLKTVESEMRELGVNALFLFGSYALDEADDHSGIDIVIEFGMENSRDLTELLRPQLALEDRFLGMEVCCVTWDMLAPAYRPYIEQTAIRIF
jgi:uncharacterized protein